MAKRFTDTGKWDHGWFRKLPPKMKCVWFYLIDKCDHAGVWIEDFDAMSFHVGEPVTAGEIAQVFGEKMRRIDADKWLIPGFIEFQYGELKSENRVHQSVISRLQKLGAYKVLRSPLKGAKDKDKDKDKEKDKEKDRAEITSEDFAAVYKTYPRKVGRTRGEKLFLSQIKTPKDLAAIKAAVANYARDCAASNRATEYVKHFDTFMGCWRDWLEPDAGQLTLVAETRFVKE